MHSEVGAGEQVGGGEGGGEEGGEGTVEGVGHGDVADDAGFEECPGADLGVELAFCGGQA